MVQVTSAPVATVTTPPAVTVAPGQTQLDGAYPDGPVDSVRVYWPGATAVRAVPPAPEIGAWPGIAGFGVAVNVQSIALAVTHRCRWSRT